MELIAFLRGELSNLNNFITILRGIPLSYTHEIPIEEIKKDGSLKTTYKKVNGTFMCGISPIIPVSIRFPEEHLNFMLGLLKPDGKNTDHIFKSKKHKFMINTLRKSMNLDPLPKSWEKPKSAYAELLYKTWAQAHLIGIKKDPKNKNGIEML